MRPGLASSSVVGCDGSAATDEDRRIRYPAGLDSRFLAELRWTTSEDHYLARMRDMFASAPAGR